MTEPAAGEPSISRDGGGSEAARSGDGAGRAEAHPAGEAARGNVEPEVDAPAGSAETWTPARGTRVSDPTQGGKEVAPPGD